MLEKIKKYFWKIEEMEFSDPPSNTKAVFKLVYEKIPVGVLIFENGTWLFKYSDEFKKNPDLMPIIDFPDKNKEYKDSELWPFFAARIPTINQPFHHKKIKRANINTNDPVGLLKIFGFETITNPFRLSVI